jgi:hypothetical protein
MSDETCEQHNWMVDRSEVDELLVFYDDGRIEGPVTLRLICCNCLAEGEVWFSCKADSARVVRA